MNPSSPINNVNSILVFAHGISDLNTVLVKLIEVNREAKLPVQVEWDIGVLQVESTYPLWYRLLSLKDHFPNVKININILPQVSVHGGIERNFAFIKRNFAKFEEYGITITIGCARLDEQIQTVAQKTGNVWVLTLRQFHVLRCEYAIAVFRLRCKVYLN